MSEGFHIEVDDDAALRDLNRIAAFLLDLRPFWPKVVPVFIAWMRAQFETEGAFAWGQPWAPLSPSYAAWKAIAHPGKGILIAEGDLRRAASNPIRRATPSSLTLTIDDPKLQHHETGTANMPARPLLFGDPLPIAASAMLDHAVESYVDDLVRRV